MMLILFEVTVFYLFNQQRDESLVLSIKTVKTNDTLYSPYHTSFYHLKRESVNAFCEPLYKIKRIYAVLSL